MPTLGQRLEQYTLKCPTEVLLVEVEVAGEPDYVVIFRGFSSSLMRSTAFDPDVPILSADAIIIQADRLRSPYNPDQPQYIEQGLDLAKLEALLSGIGL